MTVLVAASERLHPHHRFCFSFAFGIISTSLHGLYKTSEDEGQLKRKSVNSN